MRSIISTNTKEFRYDDITTEQEEQEMIAKYITKGHEEEEEKMRDEYMHWYHFSPFRKNILNWYTFKPHATILELGAQLGALTELFCEVGEKVTAVEFSKARGEAIAARCQEKDNLEVMVTDWETLALTEKYDYISLIHIFEYADMFFKGENPHQQLIQFVKQFLKPDGVILLAINNQYGAKSFAGDKGQRNKKAFADIEGSVQAHPLLTYAYLQDIIQKEGHAQVYYPFPDYRFPDIIFTDDYLPTENLMTKYFPVYMNEIASFDEKAMLQGAIKKGKETFQQFANSFLVALSPQELKEDNPIMISFNNHRKREYQLMTKIYSDRVEKQNLDAISLPHIEQMGQNILKLESYGVKVLEKAENNKVISKFVQNAITVEDCFENMSEQEIKECIIRLKAIFDAKSQVLESAEDTVFAKYLKEESPYDSKENNEFVANIDWHSFTKFHYVEDGFFDAILQNCFYINKEWYFFDQEWLEKNVPVEFMLYRTIFYSEHIPNKTKEVLYEEFGLAEDIKLFAMLERRIQLSILDMDIAIFLNRVHSYELDRDKNRVQIENLEQQVSFFKDTVDALNHELHLKEQHVHNLETIQKNQEQELVTLKEKIAEIESSVTWKMTAPLRKVTDKRRKHE